MMGSGRYSVRVILAAALAVSVCGGAAFAQSRVPGSPESTPPRSGYKQNDKKKKKSKKKASYISIKALHESLVGSNMYDETCLLYRTGDCDVVVLADAAGRVKYILLRAASGVKKAKRRAVIAVAKNRLRLLYEYPQTPQELVSADGTVALLYYDKLDSSDDDLLDTERCAAIRNLASLSEEETKLVPSPGLSCAFVIEREGVEMEIALDLSSPTVQYVEIRGGKVSYRAMSNPEKMVEEIFPQLDEEPNTVHLFFGKSDLRLRTLVTDGTYYLGRNGRFFAVGTANELNAAVKKEVNFKKYGFKTLNFSEWSVTEPPKFGGEILLEPGSKPEPGEEPPAAGNTQTPAAADSAGQPAEPATPPPAADTKPPVEEASAPLTPEAAREAYRKMLREM